MLTVRRLVLVILVFCVLPAPALAGDEPPIISRDVLFGNPDRSAVRLSPDGTVISWVAPLDGVMNVWVAPLADIKAARAVTFDKDRGVRRYRWAHTSRHLLYSQDEDGNENFRVYSLDLITMRAIALTPEKNVRASVAKMSRKFPNEVLISMNARIPMLHDLHRVDITTGKSTLHQQNEGYLGFLVDDDFNVRFASKMNSKGGTDSFEKTKDGWKPFMSVGMEDAMTTRAMGFDKTGKLLYGIDSRGRNTAALTVMNLETKETTVIAEDERADISGGSFHPTEKYVEAVAVTYARKEWQILDPKMKTVFEYLRTVDDGDVEVTSRSTDDKNWVVVYLRDDSAAKYYHFDREAMKATYLFTNKSDLDGLKLAKMHPVVIDARDGLKLVSYLSLPPWTDADGDGRPDKPLPMVLLVHGGPWARDNWGLNPLHQLLANRGYAALSVNFRGSTGLGKEFLNAAIKEWAGKMHDDLIDAVEWAKTQGIAQPDKIAIMGGSYGGYAALVGLTKTPEAFACAVDIVGPSNLLTLLGSIPPYWKPMLDMFATRVGDPRTEEGKAMLKERSPLTHVAKIKRPLLIGQGKNDPRVKEAEADQIVDAMKERGIPVTYVLYPDEGHGFRKPENSKSFWAIVESFFCQYLGGRKEPIGDDFEGSSLQVKEGKEGVPGVAEALQSKD